MKKQVYCKTAKNLMSAALTVFMTMSSLGSVAASSMVAVSAKTAAKTTKKSKKSTKKAVKKNVKAVKSKKKVVKKAPSAYITPKTKTIYTKSSAYIYLKNNKKTVKWTASNTRVTLSKKTKSSVKVYAKSSGTTYLTAKVGSKKYTCKVTVKSKSNGNSSSKNDSVKVTLDKKHYTMLYDWNNTASKSNVEKDTDGTENDADSVMITLSKAATVKWESSNNKILKIGKTHTPELGDDGFYYSTDIKFVNFGTASVYAYVNGKKYTISVTLKPSAVYYAAKKVIDENIKPGMDEAHKAYAIADWIAANTEYDISYLNRAIEPLEHILVDHKGICQDYAETYQFLLDKLSVKCRIVTSTREDHAWNQILINGKWYNADITNMSVYSPESGDRDKFFMKSDSYFNKLIRDQYLLKYRDNKSYSAASTDYDNYNWC